MMPDLIVGLLLFLSTFVVYVKHLAPSIFVGDSADATIASYVLGIPHPPGFPVYTWFGHVFTFIPVGDIAYRVNLMSAFFGALAIPVVYLIIRSLAPRSQGGFVHITSRFGSIIGAMSFAFSIYYWAQAEIAEVYTLNTFFIASIILLALIWSEKRDIRLLYLLSLLFSLSLGIVATNILFAPSILIFVFLVDRETLVNKRTFLPMVIIFLIGGALQLIYLYAIAMQEPLYAYSDIRSIENFWYFITASEYSYQSFSMPLSSGLSSYIVFLTQNFSLIGIVIGITGAALSFRRNKLKLGFLASMFIINILFFSTFNSFDIYDKFIPSFMIFSLFIGLGVLEVLDLIKTSSKRVPVLDGKNGYLIKILLIALVLSIAANVPINSYTSYSQEADGSTTIANSYFLAQVLNGIPANSTIIDVWRASVPLRYFQIVYHMNPTVEILCTDPINWPDLIQERITRGNVFVLRPELIGETLFSKYFAIPILNMPNVGVLYKVHQEFPSFSVRSPTIQHPVNKLLGDEKITLLGYDLNQTKNRDGFSITYYWQSMENVSKDYICALDLIDQHGNVALEDIHIPIYGLLPTTRWSKNEVFAERYNISLPPTIEQGTYQMFITGTWNNDESAAYDKVFLGNINVGRIDPKNALSNYEKMYNPKNK